MSVELCGTSCPGYTYLALENGRRTRLLFATHELTKLQGNECNCGTSLPKGTSFSSPPSLSRRRAIGGDCTPCAGSGAECCGAPGGYALLYRFTPYVVGSAGVAYSSMTSVGSVLGALSTAHSPTPLPSIIAYTSTGSDGSLAVGSTTSSTHVYSATIGDGSHPKPHSGTGGSSSVSSSEPGSRPSVMGSATSSIASTQGSGIISGAGNPGTTGGASITTTGVHFSASAATVNEGNGGASSTAVGSNSVVKGTLGSSGGATTANVGATPTINGAGGPEPTVTKSPSCVKSSSYAGNNTKYSDFFGYTYDIRCNLELQSTPTDSDAHADSFDDCLEYCSLLTDCIAVTYQDPPDTPKDVSNCYPKWSFGRYEASGVDGLYSGVNVNGASPGALEIQNLCTTDNEQGASYDGITYYDDFGTAWTIGCDTTLAIPNADALFATITDTLASCVDYCSIYESCDMVNWTGPHTNGTLNEPNCFPASAIGQAGAAGSTPGSGYATVNS